MSGPISFQVTVDCRDPHALARFWAAALHYELERDTAFIRGLLDAGTVSEDEVVEIDGELFFTIGAAIRHPFDAGRHTPDARDARRVLFLRVADPTPGKNRWHLDLNVGEEHLDAEVERLTAFGAEERYRLVEHGQRHVTMADPEGNLFCLQ